jgi:hypothetical protein
MFQQFGLSMILDLNVYCVLIIVVIIENACMSLTNSKFRQEHSMRHRFSVSGGAYVAALIL